MSTVTHSTAHATALTKDLYDRNPGTVISNNRLPGLSTGYLQVLHIYSSNTSPVEKIAVARGGIGFRVKTERRVEQPDSGNCHSEILASLFNQRRLRYGLIVLVALVDR